MLLLRLPERLNRQLGSNNLARSRGERERTIPRMDNEPRLLMKLVLFTVGLVIRALRKIARFPRIRPRSGPRVALLPQFIVARVVNEDGDPLAVTLLGPTGALCATDSWGRVHLPPSWAGAEISIHSTDRKELLRTWLPSAVDGALRIEVPNREVH